MGREWAVGGGPGGRAGGWGGCVEGNVLAGLTCVLSQQVGMPENPSEGFTIESPPLSFRTALLSKACALCSTGGAGGQDFFS